MKITNSFIYFSVFIFVLWLVGFAVTGSSPILNLLAFIPSSLVLLLLFVSVLISYQQGKQFKARLKRFWFIGVCLIFPLIQVMLLENNWLPREKKVDDVLTLVHWNVAWGKAGVDILKKALKSKPADIYVISEPPKKLAFEEFMKVFGKDYQFLFRYKLMIVFKGQSLSSSWALSKPGVMVWKHTMLVRGARLKFFVVDVRSDPLFDRTSAMTHLFSLMRKHKPDLIVGDLNTPRRFVKGLSLPIGYQHAYDQVGRGWSYTWPVGFSVLGLDQLIISNKVQASSYKLYSFAGSDHRLQEFKFAIKTKK